MFLLSGTPFANAIWGKFFFVVVGSEVHHRALPPNLHCIYKQAKVWEIHNLPKCIIIIVIIFISSSFFPSRFNLVGHADLV